MYCQDRKRLKIGGSLPHTDEELRSRRVVAEIHGKILRDNTVQQLMSDAFGLEKQLFSRA